MGISASFGSKESKSKLLVWLSGSTSAGRQGPVRVSSNFLRNLKRVLKIKRRLKKEREPCWQQDNNLGPKSQLMKTQNNDLTDGSSPQTAWLTRNWHHSIWRSWQNPKDSSWDRTDASEGMYTAFLLPWQRQDTQSEHVMQRDTDKNLQFFLDGLSELTDSGLNAVRELTVVFVQVPQKTGQWLWKIRDYSC